MKRAAAILVLVLSVCVVTVAGAAEGVSLVNPSKPPGVEVSILRVFGSMALVIALFLAGVWLFRNWQRVSLRNGRAPRLQVLEMRALGGRQAIYVVGYDQQRMLVSSSPTGVTLLSHLPEETKEAEVSGTVEATSKLPTTPPQQFVDLLKQALTRKSG